jgi:thiol:disulfide interchange protein DsbC
MGCMLIQGCSLNTPSKETVTAAVKQIMPTNFEVVNVVQLKELPGLIEVSVKMGNQPVVLYMDRKSQYLFSGSLLELKTKKNLTVDAQSKIK